MLHAVLIAQQYPAVPSSTQQYPAVPSSTKKHPTCATTTCATTTTTTNVPLGRHPDCWGLFWHIWPAWKKSRPGRLARFDAGSAGTRVPHENIPPRTTRTATRRMHRWRRKHWRAVHWRAVHWRGVQWCGGGAGDSGGAGGAGPGAVRVVWPSSTVPISKHRRATDPVTWTVPWHIVRRRRWNGGRSGTTPTSGCFPRFLAPDACIPSV
jgi:hypothetical protein